MMRYSSFPNEFFKKNRENLYKLLPPKSVVIIQSNDFMPTNADGIMGFRQNSDLFYLSGIDQENTFLVLFPDFPNENYREILFVQETNEMITIWEGEKLNKSQAQEKSGIETVYWTSNFDSILASVVFEAQSIFMLTNEHARNHSLVQTSNDRLIFSLKQRFPLHNFQRLSPLLTQLRLLKSDFELHYLEEAIRITEAGFRRVARFVRPNITEYGIEAEFIHEFISQRSEGFAYTPIIASGKNSCVLHYTENKNVCQNGEVLLLDVAARYGNYNADLTRVLPVSGKFSPRQKEVYQAVLDSLHFAKTLIVPGTLWDEYQKEVENFVEKQLVKLKLIDKTDIQNQDKNKPAFREYFMHGVSHFLGLDVHDVNEKYRPFEEGMVLTCEPGIYIRKEKLGIRLENNILITKGKCKDLMSSIPIEIEEIEALMNTK